MSPLLSVFVLLIVAANSQTQNLKQDSPVDGSVTFDHWAFYRFTIPASSGFVLNVQHTTNTNHDLDVYVQDGGRIPTRVSGGYVYKDTMVAPNITIQGTARTTETIYVAGVYGFKGDRTYFTIQYHLSSGCQSNCSNHGVCINNACVCNTGFMGVKCEKTVTRISVGTSYTANVKTGQWAYYSLQISRANDLSLSVSQRTGDVDVYIKYGTLPTFLSYDYADTTKQSGTFRTSLNITNPLLGVWYVGYYGISNTSFTFRFKEEKACPMKCSLHGTCVGTRCSCTTGYSGTSCEEYITSVPLSTNFSGYVDSNSWNYYRYSSSSMSPFTVKLTSFNSTDCDIYVRSDSKPTRWNFLFRNISALPNTELTIYDPGQRLWYVGVYGATSCNYTLRLETQSACPSCVNGRCVNGQCQCFQGFAGEKCDQNTSKTEAVLRSGIPSERKSVENGKWVYYQFDVVNASQVVVVVRETSTQGMAWLYLSQGRYPDNAVFDAIDLSGDSTRRYVMLEYTRPKTATFYVGVYGSPFLVGATTSVEFQAVAWASPF